MQQISQGPREEASVDTAGQGTTEQPEGGSVSPKEKTEAKAPEIAEDTNAANNPSVGEVRETNEPEGGVVDES